LKRILASLLAALLALASPFATGHGGDADATRKARPESIRLAEDLTSDLVAARASHAKASPRARPASLARMQAIAVDRRQLLELLMESDPGAVLRLALPPGARSAFPPAVQRHLERQVTEDGVLRVLHVDMPGTQVDRYLYLLKTPTGERSLRFAARPTQLLSDSRVRVKGIRLGDSIALASGDPGESLTTVSAAYPNTFGVQNTLVILVNFSNAPSQPFTPAYAQSVVFNETSGFDHEVSYQQTSLSGTVTPWYTIASTSAGCDYQAIATQARQAAAAGGYVLGIYSRFVYAFPDNACPWWGLGSVGGNPSESWIQSVPSGFVVAVVAHEMGHNFGLRHSHSLDCGSDIIGSACSNIEYGDVLDVMGGTPGVGFNGARPAGHFNAFQKELLGWLNFGISPPLTTVRTTNGVFSIGNLEAARSNTPRALKIGNTPLVCNITPKEWYYVEKREAVGYDGFLSMVSNSVPSGVVIHRVTEGDAASSFLLDMNKADANWPQVALGVGQTFTDPVTGLSIQPTSVGAGFANVSVSYAPASCTTQPFVSVSPTDVVWKIPGQVASFTVSIANADSCGCSGSAFAVSASVPGNWTTTSAQTGLLAPGMTGQAQIDVTVPANASPGLYDVTLTATAIGDPATTVSVPVSISVNVPFELSNGVPLSPIGASTDEGLIYTLVVPPGKTSLSFNTTGVAGDVDMYVRRNAVPSTSSYECKSEGPDTTESCSIASPAAGTYYVLLYAYSDFGGVSLTGQYLPVDPPTPALSIADVAISEGNAGTKQATFTVNLTPASDTAVGFDLATVPGTASPYGDFVAKSVAGQSIAAGATSSVFTVTINGDTEVEDNETLAVHLTNPTGGAVIADGQAQGRINNDDLALLSVADASIVEGNSGTTTVNFAVRLSSPMPNPVTFTITAKGGGTAVAGFDFIPHAQVGSYLDAGRTTQAFGVTINGDLSAEPNETFNVEISNVVGANLGDVNAMGTIINDDGPAVAPSGTSTQKLRTPPKRGRARLTR
jgi:hypothetical protein